MFIMDECGRRDNGNDDPKGDDIKREIDSRTVALALFFHCFRHGSAFAGDEETVVVDAVWRAGQESHEVATQFNLESGEIVRRDHVDGDNLVCEGPSRGVNMEEVSRFGLHAESVEFVEHKPVGQSGVSGYDGVRVLASRATFLTASSCCLVRV